jgi:hypothetical protein
MHLRVQRDPWSCLQIAVSSLKQASQDGRLSFLKTLYSLPEALQERPDFDALELTVLECNWTEPAARERLQSFVNDFISRNRLSRHPAV